MNAIDTSINRKGAVHEGLFVSFFWIFTQVCSFFTHFVYSQVLVQADWYIVVRYILPTREDDKFHMKLNFMRYRFEYIFFKGKIKFCSSQ